MPLVGINQGRLGFLTDISVDGMFETMAEILDGKFVAEERMLLNGRGAQRRRARVRGAAFNDVVVSKGATGSLIELEVRIDGQFVYSQRSDGLIVATPDRLHGLCAVRGRPDPASRRWKRWRWCRSVRTRCRPGRSWSAAIRVIEIHDARMPMMRAPTSTASIHFDLHERRPRAGSPRASRPVRLLHPLGYSYYDMLREKLHWSKKL